VSENPDDLEKSTFVPEYPSKWGSPTQEEKLPFEDEAISLLAKVGPISWGRGAVAIVSVYLRNAFNEGKELAQGKDEEIARLKDEAFKAIDEDLWILLSDLRAFYLMMAHKADTPLERQFSEQIGTALTKASKKSEAGK
jgi:hypothetical protein